MAKLFLVRHGNTRLNSTERFWGQTDVELGPDGIKQAKKLHDRLATEKIDTVYASSLRRTMATAEIITSRHQLDVIPCAELREINFGKIEGLTYQEIDQLYPELTKSWYTKTQIFRYPGGESIKERVLMRIGGKLGERSNVVTTRLSDEDLKQIDALVEVEAFRSRSEAAAFFIKEGIQARKDLFENVMPTVEKIRALKEQAKQSLSRE